MFTLSPLPYESDALEPYISQRMLELHHGKHHQSYVDKLNTAIANADTHAAGSADLGDLLQTSGGHLYNMAAQVWNHAFFWQCLRPDGGGEPPLPLRLALQNDFGSLNNFADFFRNAALEEFGSGWVWLAARPDGSLYVTSTTDAGNPLQNGESPLLTLDVWEHAYYLDYQNKRGDYIDAFLKHLVNWEFANKNLTEASRKAEEIEASMT